MDILQDDFSAGWEYDRHVALQGAREMIATRGSERHRDVELGDVDEFRSMWRYVMRGFRVEDPLIMIIYCQGSEHLRL